VRTDFNKVEFPVSRQDGVIGDGDPGLAAFDGKLLAVARMAADRLVEGSFPFPEMPQSRAGRLFSLPGS